MTIIIVLSGVFLVEQYSVSKSQHRQIDGSGVPLRDVLREVGNTYDCQFTMEIGLISGDQTRSLAHAPALEVNSISQLRGKSLKEVLDLFQNTIPNFTYEVNAHNPKVIHILDTRLQKLNNYALDDTVSKFNFSGYVFDLINRLEERGVNVSSRWAGDTRELNASDNSIQIKVNSNRSSVRSILTDYLHLSERGRVLWIAETDLIGNEITYVRYLSKNF